MAESRRPKLDRLLLGQIALILLLIGLSLVLYVRPAGLGTLSPRWWHWLLLAGLFFGVLWLHALRRRTRAHRDLHETIRRDAGPNEGRAEP
jgi:hypothetical protein